MPRTRTLRKWLGWSMLAILLFSVVCWQLTRDHLPRTIRIATAARGGLYSQVGTLLAAELRKRTDRTVEVIETKGSLENKALLESGGAELTILQSGAAPLGQLTALAPLYPEVSHVIVRKGRALDSIAALSGRKLALGPVGSGMRESALRLLEHYRIDVTCLVDSELYFGNLLTDQTLDGAIVTTGMVNPDLAKVMRSGDFELLPLLDAEALQIHFPFLTPVNIPRGVFAEGPAIPPEPVATVATTAILAAREDASPLLVSTTLAALYEGDVAGALPTLIPINKARAHPLASLHPAARSYLDPYNGLNILSDFMQAVAAVKELIFALAAGIYLLFDRWGRLKERENKQAKHVQKERLDALLMETVKIEREQMATHDPKQLQNYLDQVTCIKLRALEELTDEGLRGDSLFSIFLMQCANLIRKLQSKIILSAQVLTPAPQNPPSQPEPRVLQKDDVGE